MGGQEVARRAAGSVLAAALDGCGRLLLVAGEAGIGKTTLARTIAEDAHPAFAGRYDLAIACEVIHDLADPVEALATLRRVTAGGAVLVIDEKAAESFSPSGDPIEQLLYAFSILHCLPAGRDAETSAATGTVMRPDVFERYARAAGFSAVDVLDIDHPMFRFYRPRG